MRAYHSLIHTLYLFMLPVLAVAVPVLRKCELSNIYWVIGTLLPLAALAFFLLFWKGKFRDTGALRLILTAGLGAGSLIALGKYYVDAEESFLPALSAALVLLGWLHWNTSFSLLPKTALPTQWPSALLSGAASTVVVVGIHECDPCFKEQLRLFAASSLKGNVVAVGPTACSIHGMEVKPPTNEVELPPISTPMPLFFKGRNGLHPMLLVINPNGEVIFAKTARDRRRLLSPEFAARIVSDQTNQGS